MGFQAPLPALDIPEFERSVGLECLFQAPLPALDIPESIERNIVQNLCFKRLYRRWIFQRPS